MGVDQTYTRYDKYNDIPISRMLYTGLLITVEDVYGNVPTRHYTKDEVEKLYLEFVLKTYKQDPNDLRAVALRERWFG